MVVGTLSGKDVAGALQALGLRRGSVAFSHSNLAYFGLPVGGAALSAYEEAVLEPILDHLGPQGTYVVPTFTYSFPVGEVFDPDNTPSVCGVLTEMVRQRDGAERSLDPIFSVAAIGARAREMTAAVSDECFGPGSFWERFLAVDGEILGLNFGAAATFLHYIERALNVSYRYNKLFPGTFRVAGVCRQGAAVYFCRDITNPATIADWMGLEAVARERHVTRSFPVGRGFISLTRARDLHALVVELVRRDPFFLTAARGASVPPVLVRPCAVAVPSSPARPSMMERVETLWRLPRDTVSDGYDAALTSLAAVVPMTIHEYATGTSCWSWVVPERWTCHEGFLATMSGERLFSYADNPLHVASYSLPFEGVVSRAELLTHLHVHPRLPDAVPFRQGLYDRDWGLCCSQRMRNSLTEDSYRVCIRSDFTFSSLKVGEIIVPGASDNSVVLCAQLCHPGQANYGLSGVAVAIEVMEELAKRRSVRYTYRLLLLPATIGPTAHLSQNQDVVTRLKAGLFLGMLGQERPHTLRLSWSGTSEADRSFAAALREADPSARVAPFRPMDAERQFNAPGVRVPMLALRRELAEDHPDWPYPEHHSDLDTPHLLSARCLDASRDLVLRLIDALESNVTPVRRFKGELCPPRFGLDAESRLPANKVGDTVLSLIDGQLSILDIAQAAGLSFERAKVAVGEFQERGLLA